MNTVVNVLIAGVGGQGTVLASKLIAAAAIAAGLDARTAETIGMAQRGGPVTSHVRMGREIHSPLIPPGTAGLIIAFEPSEAVRVFPYLAPGGTLAVCRAPVKTAASPRYEVSQMLSYLERNAPALIAADRAELVADGHVKALNIAMLGMAAETGLLPFGADVLERALRARIPKKHLEMNLSAFAAGRAFVRNLSFDKE